LALCCGTIWRHRELQYRCTATIHPVYNCSKKILENLLPVWLLVHTSIFGLFAIFDRNFLKIVAPPSDEYENYVVHLTAQSRVKEKLKTASKSAYKQQRNACLNYAPIERTVLQTWSVTNKQTKKNKHHIFAPTASAHCAIFPKLCMVIELVVPIIKDVIHFWIQCIVFPTGCTEKFRPNLPTRSFSVITP